MSAGAFSPKKAEVSRMKYAGMETPTSRYVAVSAARPYFRTNTIRNPKPTSSMAITWMARSYFWTCSSAPRRRGADRTGSRRNAGCLRQTRTGQCDQEDPRGRPHTKLTHNQLFLYTPKQSILSGRLLMEGAEGSEMAGCWQSRAFERQSSR